MLYVYNLIISWVYGVARTSSCPIIHTTVVHVTSMCLMCVTISACPSFSTYGVARTIWFAPAISRTHNTSLSIASTLYTSNSITSTLCTSNGVACTTGIRYSITSTISSARFCVASTLTTRFTITSASGF